MDHYAVETRQDKVSLSIVPKLCGGQVWVGFLRCLGLKISWIKFQKNSGASPLALSPEESDTPEVNTDVKTSRTFSKTGKKRLLLSLELVALKLVFI